MISYGQFIGPNILTEKTRVLRRVNLYNLSGSLLVNRFGADIFSASNRFHVDELASQESLDQGTLSPTRTGNDLNFVKTPRRGNPL
jgi:hypothetical protein